MIASIPPARKMVSLFAGVAAPLPIATMHCRPHQKRHEQELSTRARHLIDQRRGGVWLCTLLHTSACMQSRAYSQTRHVTYLHLHGHVLPLLLHEAHQGPVILSSSIWRKGRTQGGSEIKCL